MPEICERIEILADEYFHGELSPEDKNMLESHIKSCEICAEFFENERRYFEEIKIAAHEPELDIAAAVMDKIIAGRITVNKPAKKRFVPFGLISAAAIVLVMLIASRDTLNLFVRQNDVAELSDNNVMLYGDYAADDSIFRAGVEGEWAAPIGIEIFASDNDADMFMTDDAAVESEAVPAEAEEFTPAAQGARDTTWNLLEESGGIIIEPGEIIKIARGYSEDFYFRGYIYINGSVFINREDRDALLEDFARYNIEHEIEDMGVESEFIKIIYIY